MMPLVLLFSPLAVFDQEFETEELLNLGIALFALVLLVLTLSTYRRTHLRRLLLVSAAFGLFAVEVAVRQLDAIVFAVGYQTDQVITAVMEFIVLMLFFLAVVMKN
jgi:hypothetical protein